MKKLFWKIFLEEHYPLTIVSDRYGGSYSGGKFTAWPELFYRIPEAIEGDDIACSTFWWKEADTSLIGIGSTPEVALNDLLTKVKKQLEEEPKP